MTTAMDRPMTTGLSRWFIASTIDLPMPGMRNTVSTTKAPPMRPLIWLVMEVTTGISAFLRACFQKTSLFLRPLEYAVMM